MSVALAISSEVVTVQGSSSIPPRNGVAHAFAGGKPPTTAIQVAARWAEERGRITVSGVPRSRAQQTLAAILSLRCFNDVPMRHLHLDVLRAEEGKYRGQFGLAMAVAMASALGRQPVPAGHLFLGDVGLAGEVLDVRASVVDALNDAISDFSIETPLTVLLATDSAAWVNGSSTVHVEPVRSLADVVRAVWPAVNLSAF